MVAAHCLHHHWDHPVIVLDVHAGRCASQRVRTSRLVTLVIGICFGVGDRNSLKNSQEEPFDQTSPGQRTRVLRPLIRWITSNTVPIKNRIQEIWVATAATQANCMAPVTKAANKNINA